MAKPCFWIYKGKNYTEEEMKALLPDIPISDREQFRLNLSSDELLGFTSQEEYQLIQAVGAIAIEEIKNDPKVDKRQIFERVYERLKIRRIHNKKGIIDSVKGSEAYYDFKRFNRNLDKIIGESINNEVYVRLTELVDDYIESHKELLPLEEGDRDAVGRKLFDEESFHKNPINTAGWRTRAFLATQNEKEYAYIEEEGKRVRRAVDKHSIIGSALKLPANAVYNYFLVEFSGMPMNKFLPTLKKLSKYNASYESIYEKLLELSQGTLDEKATFKEFHSNLSKQHIKFLTGLYDFDTKDTRIIDSSRDNALNTAIRRWEQEFKRQFNNSKGFVRQDPNGNLFVRTEKIKEIYKKYQEKKDTKEVRQNPKLTLELGVELLKNIGINFKEEAVDLMLNEEDRKLINIKFTPGDFTTAVKLIFDKLTSGEENEKSIENSNPFAVGRKGEFVQMALLANIHLKTDPTIFAESFLDEGGKIRYSFSENTQLSIEERKLKDSDYVDSLLKIPYESHIYYLQQLKNSSEFRKIFEVSTFSALNEQNSWGQAREWDEMSSSDKLLTDIMLFTNAGFKEQQNISYITFPIMGDRNTIRTLKVPRLRPKWSGTRYDAHTLNLVYEIFLSEMISIKQVKEHIKEGKEFVKDVHTGEKAGLRYHLLPFFNDFTLEIQGNKIKPEDIDYLEYEEEDKRVIEEQIKSRINEFLVKNTNDHVTLFNKEGLELEHIGQNYLDTLASKNPENQIRELAREYSINKLVGQSNIFQLFWGNMAFYKNKDEAIRRGAMLTSPGADMYIEGDSKIIFVKDVFARIRNYDNLHEALKEGLKAWGIKNPVTRAGEILASYNDPDDPINTTDSQAIGSFSGYRKILDSLGRFTEETSNVLTKLENKQPLTEEDIGFIKPLKLVFTIIVYNEDLNMRVPIKIKFSIMPPILGYNKELDLLQKEMKDKGVEILFFESAVKTAVSKLQDFYSDKEQTNVLTINKDLIHSLPWEGFREQQITPDTDISEKKSADQMLRQIFTDLKGLDVKLDLYDRNDINSLRQFYENLRVANTKEARREFESQLGVIYKEGKIKITNLKKLSKFLKESAKAAKFTPNALKAFELEKIDIRDEEEQFIVPLYMIPNGPRFDYMLNSLIGKRIILQKIFQDSFVSVSDIGGKIISFKDIPSNVRNKIEWVNKAKKELLFYREENGKILPMQSILPHTARKFFTQEGKIKPEFSKFVGHRDPSQGANSLFPSEVVGFFPEGVRSLIVYPYEFLKQAGPDFDFDKVPAYFYKGEWIGGEYVIIKYLIGEKNKTVRYTRYKISKEKSTAVKKIYDEYYKELAESYRTLYREKDITPGEVETMLQRFNVSLKNPLLQEKLMPIFGNTINIVEEVMGYLVMEDIILSEDKFYELTEEEQNGKDARNNAMLDIILELASKKEFLNKLLSANTQAPIKEANRLIDEKLNPKEDLVPATGMYELQSSEANSSGKFGVQVFSNMSAILSASQWTELKIRKVGSDGTLVSSGIKFNNSKGEVYDDMLLNKIFTFEGELISDVIQHLQTASLDNLHHLQLQPSNLNEMTIPIAGLLALKGYSDNLNKDDGIIIPFLRQSIIRSYVKMMERKTSPAKRKGRSNDTIKKEVKQKLRAEYLDAINMPYDDAFAPKFGLEIKAFSKNQLIKNIEESDSDTYEDKAQYHKDQLEILNHFLHLEDISNDLTAVGQTINSSTQFKSNFFDVKRRNENYKKLSSLKYIENAEQLIKDNFIGIIGEQIEFTEILFAHPNLLGYGLPLWKNIEEKVNILRKGQFRMNLTQEKFFKVLRGELNAFTTSLLQNGVYKNRREEETVQEFQSRLLIGEDSVAKRLLRLKDGIKEFEGITEGKENWLTQTGLDIEISGIQDEIDKITVYANRLDPSLKEIATRSIISLLKHEKRVVRELGEDFIAYIYITTGGNRSNVGLATEIPMEYLFGNFGKFYNSDEFLDWGRKMETAEIFEEQFMRKNPTYADKLNINSIRPIKNNPNVIILNRKNPAKYIYTSVKDSKTNKRDIKLYRYYAKEGYSVEYHRIPLLYSYDANTDIPQSILKSHNLKERAFPIYKKTIYNDWGSALMSKEDLEQIEGAEAELLRREEEEEDEPLIGGRVEPEYKLTGKEKDFPHNFKHNIKSPLQKSKGFFIKELLDKGITNTYDAVKEGLRTQTSRSKTQDVKVDDIITISATNQPKIPVKVTKVNTKTTGQLIKENPNYAEEWSKKQGWTKEYLKDNPDVLNKYDIEFELLGKEFYQLEKETEEGVDFVFKRNPELENIGSKQLYSRYLDTIFPNSKVRDIVYRGDEAYNIGGKILSRVGGNKYTNGIYFAKSKIDAAGYIYDIKKKFTHVFSAILNLKNPKVTDIYDKEITTNLLTEEQINSLKSKNIDGLDVGLSGKQGFEYVVFEPEQIHILGSKQDIEGFKNFIIENPLEIIESPDEKLDAIMRNLITQLGGDIKLLEKLKTRHGFDAVASTDLLTKTIKVVKGKADITTLPEEAATLFVAMLGIEHPMVQRMLSLIDKTDIYQKVKNDYELEYEGREEDIKLETIHKFLAKYIVSQHKSEESNRTLFQKLINTAKMIWNRIKQIFSRVDDTRLQKEIDEVFGEGAERMRTLDIGGITEKELKGRFYQIDDKDLTRMKTFDTFIINWKERKRLIKRDTKKDPKEKRILIRKLDNNIKQLSEKRDIEYILSIAENDIKRINDKIRESESMSIDERISFYRDSIDILEGLSEIGGLIQEGEGKSRIANIINDAKIAIEDFKGIAEQIYSDVTQGEYGDLKSALEKTGYVEANILDASTSKDPRVRAIFHLVDRTIFHAQTSTDTSWETTDKATENLEKYLKTQGMSLSDAYALMLQTDKNGKWNKNYLFKYKSEYYDKLNELKEKAKETGNYRAYNKFKKDNSVREVDYESYERDKKNLEEELKKDNGEWIDEGQYLNFIEDYDPDGHGKYNNEYLTKLEPIDKWIDPRWRDIKEGRWKGTEIEKFYDYFVEEIEELKSKVPDWGIYKQRENYIPELMANLIQRMIKTGVINFMKGFSTKFKESVKQGWTVAKDAPIDYQIRDSKGNVIKEIPLSMFHNKLSPEDKSSDLSAVLKVFSAVAHQYEAQATVEPVVSVILRAMSELKTKVMSGGVQRIDKYGELESIMDSNNYTLSQVQSYANAMIWNQRRKAQKGNERPIRKVFGITIPLDTYIDENGNVIEEQRIFSLFKAFGHLQTYTQLLGMGFNFFAAVTNIIFGPLTNLVWAAGGTDFTLKDMFKAYRESLMLMVLGSKEQQKIIKMFKAFHFQGLIMESQYEDAWWNKDAFSLAYFMQHAGEIVNQSQVMIAYMNAQKVEYEKGKFISMWDGFIMKDRKLVWDTKYGDNPIPAGTDAQYNIKKKVQQIIFNNHGPYASNVPMKAKEEILGRMLFIFRTWLPRSYFTHFASERPGYDGEILKGRFVTAYEQIEQGKFWRGMFGIGLDSLSDIDKANMKKTRMELLLGVAALIGGLMLRGIKFDDDDEEQKALATFLINQMGRTSGELMFWLNPFAVNNIIDTPFPAYSATIKLGKLIPASVRLLQGNDELQAGPNRGHSNFLISTERAVPGWAGIGKVVRTIKGRAPYLREQGFEFVPAQPKKKKKELRGL